MENDDNREEIDERDMDEAEREAQIEREIELQERDEISSEYKFETFQELTNQLEENDFTDDPEQKHNLIKKLQEQFLESVKDARESSEETKESLEEPPDIKYYSYNFARSAAIMSLEFSWNKFDLKIKSLIEQLKQTNLTDTKIEEIERVVDKLHRQCIKKIIDFEKPKDKESNETLEPEKFEEIVKRLPDIYSELFDVFLEPVTNWISSRGSHRFVPDSIRFRAYNLDLRKKKVDDKQAGREHIPDYSTCNYDYYHHDLRRDPETKGRLYQGYWQVEPMMTELRNTTEHWKKRQNKIFLNNELNRPMQDPVSETESLGNLIVLINVLMLISYNFIEVMQTWIDTDTLLKK